MRYDRHLAVSASLLAIMAAGASQPATAATCTWAGGAGFYNNPALWSCGVQPGVGDAVVVTAGGSVVTISGISANAGTINLGAGNAINVSNSNLTIFNNAFTNNGTTTIAGVGGGTSSLLSGSGIVTFSGAGVLVLDDTAGGARIYNGGFAFDTGQTVRGSGQLGINQAIFSNAGLISADVNGRTLDVDASAGNGGVGAGNGFGTGGNAGFYNTGTMQASNGGTLAFEGGLYENSASGVIKALAGSAVNLNGDSRIVNGTLTSVGTGVINANGTTQYLTNVTLSAGSNLKVVNDTLNANTTLTNNGTLTIKGVGGGTATLLNETSTLTLGGTGTIVLDNSDGAARIYGGNITFGAGQTVQGAGQLGINQTLFTINNVFSANAGSNLDIDVSAGNGGVGVGNGIGTNLNSGLLNNSTIQATGGSTLNFGGGLYENSATGVIQALAGSTVNLGGDSRILNGTLTSVGTGVINASGTTQYLTNVTLSSGTNLKVVNDTLNANTTLTNNGTLTIKGVGGGTATLLNETSTLTLGGTGTIVLDNSDGGARIYGGSITFGTNQAVRGGGQLGINQTIFTNNNVFSATAGSNLDIDVSAGNGGVGANTGVGTNGIAGLLNNNIIEATGGSTLSFEGGLYENVAGGIIRALSGSTINLNGDSRILNGTLTSDATSVINANSTTQYLTNVTLSAGSNLKVVNDTLNANTTLTNNGTLTIKGVGGGTATLLNETGTLTLGGTGTIVLDNSDGSARIYSGNITIGNDATVRGAGQLGINQTIVTNNGFISADAGTGTGISIDVSAGNGGVGANNGVGTNGNSGLLNNGVLSALNGSTLALEGGLYENGGAGLGGELFANAGSTVVFNGDASFLNLKAGGVLDSGRLYASSAGAAATINLRSNAANSLVTIGTASGNTTEVILQGSGSVIEVTPFGGGAPVTIDQTLTGVAGAGVFALQDRNFTVSAGGGNFGNAGLVFVNNTVFTSNSFSNSGSLISDATSTITAPIANSGTVHVASGVLNTQAITGATGTILTDAGATLNLGGTSTAGTLTNNGTLALGTRNITVTSDYTNANFGSGNAFAGHAHVTGTGQILATNATMDLSAPGLVGNVLSVGNVRVGGSTTTQLTVTNNGLQTTLRGAVQNVNAPGVSLSQPDFVVGPNGGSAIVTIGFSGNTAGSLAGQSLDVKNNFDNVAARTLTLNGNVYQIAVAGAQPATITLGAQRVGGAPSTAAIVIKNTAPDTNGFTEKLSATATSGGSGFLVNGAASATTADLSFGATQAVSLSHGTGTSGSFSNTVTIANTSIAVPASGLGNLALATQSIAVKANVYQAAVASVGASSVDFGPVRQGAASPLRNVSVTNGASGALTDALVTTITGQSGGVSGSAPASLGAGATGNAVFSLDTSVARVVSGAATLNFTSHDAELADLGVGSQSLSFAGTVTQTAIAQLFKNAGVGTLTGNGTSYNLDLGSFSFGSGSVSSDIGVNNAILASAFAESLGGSFIGGTGNGYSFSGAPFANVQGGSSDTGNLLTFNYTGLNAGTYTNTVTFNGFSRFAGLADLSLSPIALNIRAQVTGGAAAVPEPAIWLQMIMGFMIVGGTVRARRTSYKLQANR